jgi:ribulose-phosphate 3-epimerase
MKPQIIPAILETEKEAVEKRLKQVRDWVERIQIDIIDGKFANNRTLGLEDLMEINKRIGWDIHLLVEEPIQFVEQCFETEAGMVIGQIELMESQREFIKLVKAKGMRAGLGLDLKTAVDFLEEEVLSDLDQVLLMAVAAGFSGQKFNEKVLAKIKLLRQMGFEKEIAVDGGLNQVTIEACVKAGADVLVVGSALWQAVDLKKELAKLRRLADKAASR